MAEIKKISTEFQLLDKFLDTSGDAGSANQVLVSTTTGVNWVDGSGSGIIGGPYLPLSAGASYPLTGNLVINSTSSAIPVLLLNAAGNANCDITMQSTNTSSVTRLRTGVNDFQIHTNGSQRVTVTSAGNVGINVTVPNQKLHVSDGGIRVEKNATGLGGFISIGNATEAAGNYSAYFFGNTASDTGYFKGGIAYETLSSTYGRGDMHFLQNSTTSGGNVSISDSVMTILNGGNVGIGTTSPGADLDVHSSINISNPTSTINEVADLNLRTYSSNWGYRQTKISSTLLNTTTGSNRLDFTIADASITGGNIVAMSILSTGGNVGIGLTLPTKKFEVNSGTISDIVRFGNDAGGIVFGYSTNLASIDLIASQAFRIRQGSTTPLYIKSNGNVGIGTTSPDGALSVENTGTAGVPVLDIINTSNAQFNHSGEMMTPNMLANQNNIFVIGRQSTTKESGYIGYKWSSSGSNSNVLTFGHWGSDNLMNIDGLGNVGIGTTSPGQKLHLNNSATLTPTYQKFTNGTATTGTTLGIDADGDFIINNGEAKEIKLYTSDTQRLTISSAGAVKFNSYNSTNNTGTPTYLLGTDASGNVVKTNTVPGSAAGPYLPLSAGSSYPLTGALHFGDAFNYIEKNASSDMLMVANRHITFSDVISGVVNERMRIEEGGNVGIGLTDPTEKLQVAGDVIIGSDTLAGGRSLTLLSASNAVDYDINFKQTGTTNFGRIRFTEGASDFQIIAQVGQAPNLTLQYGGNSFFSRGNVGIGTTSPDEKLDVAGNIKIQAALLSNQDNTDVDTGTETVANVAIATYTAAFFDFVIKKGTNVRSGTVYACHDGTNVEFTETSTNDLGDTSDVTLSVDISGTNMRLRATSLSESWSVKSLIRAI